MRLELRYGRAPWRMRLRVEERSAAGGVARFTSVRLFREGGLTWQLAAGLASLDGDAPDLWWYRRRAGGLYAWDRLGEGAWVGAWARLGRGRTALEMSLVNRASGWSGGVGLRTDLGGPDMLDPALQHY